MNKCGLDCDPTPQIPVGNIAIDIKKGSLFTTSRTPSRQRRQPEQSGEAEPRDCLVNLFRRDIASELLCQVSVHVWTFDRTRPPTILVPTG